MGWGAAHMKTQKDPGQVPLTMAGPRLLAGLMEQPSMGSITAWAQNTAKPGGGQGKGAVS